MYSSESQESVQRELSKLDQELEKQAAQQLDWQMKELLELRQALHSLEKEKQLEHLKEVTATRSNTPTACVKVVTVHIRLWVMSTYMCF